MRLRYFLCLLQLLAASPFLGTLQADDFPNDFPPTLSYHETYVSTVQSDGFGGYQLGASSKLVFTGKCSLKGVDISTFDTTTEVTLSCNDLSIDNYLGDDPNYVKGAKIAHIPLPGTDPNTGDQLQGTLTLTWSSTHISYTLTINQDESDYDVEAQMLIDEDLSYGADYSDTPIVTFSFGDLSLTRTLYINGTVNFTQDPKERVTDDLANINLTGMIDSIPPTNVAITYPAAGAKLNLNPYTITGTAADNNGISQVLVQVNDGTALSANLVDATHWSLPGVSFAPGSNKISVQAIDLDGNTTTGQAVTISYSPISTLVVGAAGPVGGKVTSSSFKTLTYDPAANPSPSVSSQQHQGSKLTATAVPAAGALFDHWTSSEGPLVNAESSTLTFTMAPNLVLTANFVVNPYLPIQGTYQGLITSADPSQNGFFTVVLSPTGSFTGSIRIGTLMLPIKGHFGSSSQAFTGTFTKGGIQYTVALQTATTGAGGAGQITGTISGPNSLNGSISSDVAGFKKKTNELSAADYGTYHVLLPAAQSNSDANFPAGIGYGVVTISKLGATKFIGKLGDGTAVTAGATLSQGRMWPFYAAPYGKTGVITGNVTLDHTTDSDLSGNLLWLCKPAVKPVTATKFPTGFSGQSQFLGAMWTPVPVGQLAFLSPSAGQGMVTIDAPAVVTPALPALNQVQNQATLSSANVAAVTAAAPFQTVSVKVNRAAGFFTGNFTLTGSTKTYTFGGVIVSPKVNAAGGYFTWGNVTGSVSITGP